MRPSLTSVVAGLGMALALAAAILAAAEVQISSPSAADGTILRFGHTLLAVTTFAILPAGAAIALAEARRVRGLPFWLGAGLIVACAGLAWQSLRPEVAADGDIRLLSCLALPAAGLAGGWFYWWWTGYRSGAVAVALREAGEIPLGPALSAGRCKVCTGVSLLLGLIPLTLAGTALIYRAPVELADRLTREAQVQARTRLDKASLGYLSVTFDNTVGKVTGTPPRGIPADVAYKEAETALAPLVGVPGIVARLDNGIDDASAAVTKP
jgi:hypothetical protein